MKKLFFACAILGSSLAGPGVSAQDFCCPPACDPCCGDSFDGFYVGGNVGVISHTAHRNDLDGFLSDNSGWTIIDTDVTAGVLLGYDWQCSCNKLFGLVVDWNWANNRFRHEDDPSTPADINFIDNRHHWFSTIRARFGVTVCDALVYVTGGGAVSRFRTRWFDDDDDVDGFFHRHTRWGWTGGVGTEFLLGCNWSLGAELLFLQFSERRASFVTDGGATFAFGHSDSAWIGRIVLNYRFGDLFCCR